MISVNRNFGSLVGQLSLKTANNAVETAVERLSSGARVNSAAFLILINGIIPQTISQIRGFFFAFSTEKVVSFISSKKNLAVL